MHTYILLWIIEAQRLADAHYIKLIAFKLAAKFSRRGEIPFNHVRATRKTQFSNGSKRGFPFGRDLRRPTQTQSALYMLYCLCTHTYMCTYTNVIIYIPNHTYIHTSLDPNHTYIHTYIHTYFSGSSKPRDSQSPITYSCSPALTLASLLNVILYDRSSLADASLYICMYICMCVCVCVYVMYICVRVYIQVLSCLNSGQPLERDSV